MGVFDRVTESGRFLLFDFITEVGEDLVIERRLFLNAVVAILQADAGQVFPGLFADVGEEAAEVDEVGLGMVGELALAQVLGAADEVVEFSHPEGGHVLTHLFGDGVEEVHDVVDFAFELGAVFGILGRDADGTVVEVAAAHVDAAHRDESDGTEVVFLGSEDGGVDDVKARAQTAVGPQGDPVAETVQHQNLLRLGESEFPGQAGVLDRTDGRGAGATVVSGDEDDVGLGFGDAGGDGADPGLGDEFDGDLGGRIDLLQIVNELREILDRIDIVVGRRGDEGDAGLGVAESRDESVHFRSGKLPALAGLGSLRHFDFDLLGGHEVGRADAEAPRGDLLDLGIAPVAVGIGFVATRVFAAFAAVGFSSDAVHRDGESLVGFGTDGP